MEIINKNINELKPYSKNAKKHTKEQIDYVANSIKKFGFRQPLVIDNEDNIIIGHCRWEALKKLKSKIVPCVIADDLTEEQVKALRLADNKTNESEWDIDLLIDELDDLLNIDMSEFGFILNIGSPVEGLDLDNPTENKPDCKIYNCPKCGFQFEVEQ